MMHKLYMVRGQRDHHLLKLREILDQITKDKALGQDPGVVGDYLIRVVLRLRAIVGDLTILVEEDE